MLAYRGLRIKQLPRVRIEQSEDFIVQTTALGSVLIIWGWLSTILIITGRAVNYVEHVYL